MYVDMPQVQQQILREINSRCLSYQITVQGTKSFTWMGEKQLRIFPCPLITSTSVLVLSI